MNRELKEIQVGKVMLTPKGEYDASKNYVRLDVVTHKGSSYVCLADTTSEPPNDNWQLLAEKGATGETGKTGNPGKNGQDGRPGQNGESAYQQAVDNGFSGTLSEWLASLKGQKGDPGPQGVPGKDGKDGKSPDTSVFATHDDLAGLYLRKVIPTGIVDFNTLTNSGEYLVRTESVNGPVKNTWSYVFVSGDSGSRVAQFVLLDNSDLFFYRRKEDSKWDSWIALANFSDILDKIKDYYTKSETDTKLAGKANHSDIPTTMDWKKSQTNQTWLRKTT